MLQCFGLAPVVVIDVISFLIPTVAITLINVPLEDRDEQQARRHEGWKGAIQDWLLGWRYAWETPLVVHLLGAGMLLFVASGIIAVAFVAFMRHVLGGSPEFYSWTLTAQGASSIAGGVVIGYASRRVGPGGLVAVSVLIVGVLALLEVIAATQPATLAVSILIGAPTLFISAGLMSLLQGGVSDAFRGRMYGSYISIVNIAGLAGTTLATSLTDSVGVRPMFFVAGALLTISGLVGVRVLPRRTPDIRDAPWATEAT